jgi:hypothetical protein
VNTDRLIDLLSANLEPVSRGRFATALILAAVTGGVAAFALMLATVGPRPHFDSPPHLEWCAIKMLFALSVVVAATPILARSARPGPSSAARCIAVFIPFVAVGAAAAAALLSEPALWREMLVGATTASPVRCLLCIVGFAAIPLTALFAVLREGAPTRPRASGALAGTVAGGVGAAAYALACSSDSIPFIAAWYGAAIGLYALFGALLGPRFLHW